MKKMLSIAAMVVLVWGCAKKVTPQGENNSGSNTGSTISDKPGSYPAGTNSASQTASTNAATSPTDAAKTGGAISSTGSTVSPEVLGQRTFNAKCGRCHGLKVTTDYTRERWISIMQVMAMKANLDAVEKENVLAYVTANAKR